MPQKNPLGNVNSGDPLKGGSGVLATLPALAREDPLHPGSVDNPAAAPAPTIDWTNLRRVRRNLDSSSLEIVTTFRRQLCLINFPFFCPLSEL